MRRGRVGKHRLLREMSDPRGQADRLARGCPGHSAPVPTFTYLIEGVQDGVGMRRRGPIARPTSQPARGGSRACGRCGRCGRKEVIRQAVVRSWPSPVAKGRHLGCKHLLIAKIQNLERTLEGDVVSEGGHAVGGAGSRGRRYRIDHDRHRLLAVDVFRPRGARIGAECQRRPPTIATPEHLRCCDDR
jgi:hypothetical protein